MTTREYVFQADLSVRPDDDRSVTRDESPHNDRPNGAECPTGQAASLRRHLPPRQNRLPPGKIVARGGKSADMKKAIESIQTEYRSL